MVNGQRGDLAQVYLISKSALFLLLDFILHPVERDLLIAVLAFPHVWFLQQAGTFPSGPGLPAGVPAGLLVFALSGGARAVA